MYLLSYIKTASKMQICIIGLPNSGKSTIFHALTMGRIETTAHISSALAPVIGTTKVPDDRLTTLEEIFKPARVIPTEIKYVDIAGTTQSTGKGKGIYGPYLNYLSNADALIQVIRTFENNNVPHLNGTIDASRDLANMDLELIFSDITIIDKRLTKLDIDLKGAKAFEKDTLIKEKSLLLKIKQHLENELPIWKQDLDPEEHRIISNYQFLTAKPMLIIVNIDEKQIEMANEIENKLRDSYGSILSDVISMSGKLEMELTQLKDNEAEEFRQSLGLKQSAINRIISASFKLLGLISFFTTASSELKVWTIRKGTSALKAAGKIHSDMEHGFIRAEVIGFNDLKISGNIYEAKKHGLLRLEGKNYQIQDGDIITFLFNI